ncbi:MAG: type II toxin-antitoxin system prevent-host-death family antitoxin [Betaproteobacteria bacterium]|nr:MAG: type II toxin-antitoxin system prevent-host-death family antitoxin [Betaproteobacteria bacterium]
MDRVGIYDAKARFSELVAAVAKGREVVITRRGKPVARLLPPEAPRKGSATRAAKRIRALCERLNIRGVKVRELIEEGRD